MAEKLLYPSAKTFDPKMRFSFSKLVCCHFQNVKLRSYIVNRNPANDLDYRLGLPLNTMCCFMLSSRFCFGALRFHFHAGSGWLGELLIIKNEIMKQYNNNRTASWDTCFSYF